MVVLAGASPLITHTPTTELESPLSFTPLSVPHRLGLAVTVAILATVVSCSGDSTAEDGAGDRGTVVASAATSPGAEAAPSRSGESSGGTTAGAQASLAAPDPARAMDHIERLAVEIGPRPAGSEAEREAADYIASQLTAAGYDANIEEFTFEAERDDSQVTLAEGDLLRALALQGSAMTEASGLAVHGGLGRPEDLAGADLSGKVVILDRGIVTFGDKARAAEAGGAIAVIVVNDQPGLFLGSLGDGTSSSIPVVSVSGESAEALEAQIGQRVTVLADAGRETITSQNVVASVDSGACRAYLGGHYDSVTVSPGANDNASGTAVVLEVARVNPVPGLCVVLFGAEELGLFGSQNYVATHLAGTGRFMLNVDMAGRLDGPSIVGDRELTDAILEGIKTAGIESSLVSGRFPPGASSDHVSFESVGVPAVTFNAGNDEALHTAADTIDRIQPDAVAMFVAAVDAALDALVAEHLDALAR